jgi:hypothetical protein
MDSRIRGNDAHSARTFAPLTSIERYLAGLDTADRLRPLIGLAGAAKAQSGTGI